MRAKGQLNEKERPLRTDSAGHQQHQSTGSLWTSILRYFGVSDGSGNQAVEGKKELSVSVIKQLETGLPSPEQVSAGAGGISLSIDMVERKCIAIDKNLFETREILDNQQWQGLSALHHRLLQEYYNFLVFSQYPSPSSELHKPEVEMTARMWRHGIQSFLQLLMLHLPASLEHTSAFICRAYEYFTLLHEAVPAFQDTWTECLGDVSRYGMAIEEDIHLQEKWTALSRYWYMKKSDKNPATGRLYHHLAVLARPNAVQQLCYYTKSLYTAIPFPTARENIRTLFNPILTATKDESPNIDLAFVKTHGLLFTASNSKGEAHLLRLLVRCGKAKDAFLSLLDPSMNSQISAESAAFMAISNSNSLLEYGMTFDNTEGTQNVIMSMISLQDTKDDVHSEFDQFRRSEIFSMASRFVEACDSLFFKSDVLAYLVVRLSFLNFLADQTPAMEYLDSRVPWSSLASKLNSFYLNHDSYDRIEAKEFPRPMEKKHERPLPEDWILGGLFWTDSLFPSDWFNNKIDKGERSSRLPSMAKIRQERVLWLARKLASRGKWLTYLRKGFSVRRFDERPPGTSC